MSNDESAIAEPQDPMQALGKIMETVKKEAGSLFPKEKLEVRNVFNLKMSQINNKFILLNE